LHDSAHDQACQGSGARADERADGECGDGDEKEAALALHVSETADYRRSGDRGEQEPCEEPGGGGERGSLRPLHRRQDREDHELLEPEVERTQSENPGDEAIASTIGGLLPM
jgi:hypothetical protein